jgi:hypothetical protein
MELALVAVVVATLIGLAREGSLHALADTQFRVPFLLVVGFAVQLTLDVWDPAWLTDATALAALLLSNVLVAFFIFFNRGLPGMSLALLGLALNVVVMSANGGMPVSREAAERSGATASVSDAGAEHEVLDAETALPWLGDVIPIPPVGLVVSVGDVLLAAGIGWLTYARTTARRWGRTASRTASG